MGLMARDEVMPQLEDEFKKEVDAMIEVELANMRTLSGIKPKKKKKGKKKKKKKKKKGKKGKGDDDGKPAKVLFGPTEVVQKFDHLYNNYVDAWVERDETSN